MVVIGAGGRIAGYAVADDVSARDLQGREPQWTRAKGFDSVVPVGPVDHDRGRAPRRRGARDPLRVNGEPRQDSTTDDLVFGPQELVDFIAETCTLEPGDLILTGTPQGVGVAMDPPRFLEPGDVVRIEIERLGSIEHPSVLVDHAVDQPVLGGLRGREEAVALHVAVDLLLGLARVVRVDLVDRACAS